MAETTHSECFVCLYNLLLRHHGGCVFSFLFHIQLFALQMFSTCSPRFCPWGVNLPLIDILINISKLYLADPQPQSCILPAIEALNKIKAGSLCVHLSGT